MASAYGTCGLAYDHLDDLTRAVADYSESICLHPTPLKYRLRGRCYEMLREHERVVADFKEADRLQRVSKNSEAQLLRN
jgi:tetratricopeptide (TPR) repeat protein